MSVSSGGQSLASDTSGGHRGRHVQITVKACPAFESVGRRNYRNLSLNLHPGLIGRGTFGVICQAELPDTGELVAVKKVFQDPRYKNRELLILYKLGTHCNIVELKYHFFSQGSRGRDDIYLNLVMELFPESLANLLERHRMRGSLPSVMHTKAFAYQMLRALNYMHSHCICHRDIKSVNLLVCEKSLRLCLCDMGSAKEMDRCSSNVSYISSRYYRAPELLFGSTKYTCSIDLWSAGCVLAEMAIGYCLFMAHNSLDQLVAIIRVLGTPTKEDVAGMNAEYSRFTFPHIPPDPHLNFPPGTPEDLLDLLCQLLTYHPQQRLHPLKALTHRFFDELRDLRDLPDGTQLPNLFDFADQELLAADEVTRQALAPRVDETTKAGDD